MSRNVTISALLAGAALAAALSLPSASQARPLPVQNIDSLAGESNVTTVQARRARVVRSTRTVRRGRVVRTYRAVPRRAAYRYRTNRNAAVAAGLAIGAIGAIAATTANAGYYDPYYGSGYGYGYGAYPAGYSTWGYDSPYYYGGYAPAVTVGYYGGGYYGRPYYGRYRYGYRTRYATPAYVRRNPAIYGNVTRVGYGRAYPGRAYYGRAYRGQAWRGGVYRNRGAVYYGNVPAGSYGRGWGGGLGPMGNPQTSGMPYAR